MLIGRLPSAVAPRLSVATTLTQSSPTLVTISSNIFPVPVMMGGPAGGPLQGPGVSVHCSCFSSVSAESSSSSTTASSLVCELRVGGELGAMIRTDGAWLTGSV
jgi:hypothetical protein